jgi:hypothetical protein
MRQAAAEPGSRLTGNAWPAHRLMKSACPALAAALVASLHQGWRA